MDYKTLEKAVRIVMGWEMEVAKERLAPPGHRAWFADLANIEKFTRAILRKFTDRSLLNKEFKERFVEKDVAKRKAISALQVEVGLMYGMTSCVVQRYRGRLHYYRADSSMKQHTTDTVDQALEEFDRFKSNLG